MNRAREGAGGRETTGITIRAGLVPKVPPTLKNPPIARRIRVVGAGGIEPPTSAV